ncbi:MAG: M1 family aminopeptidase [Thermoanaerobaculia bacterium]
MRLPRLAAAALALLLPAAAFAAEVDPTYAALRAARPTGRAVSVRDFTLERDAFRFRFASGTFQFLPEIAGRTVGAVFVGEGSFELSPATEAERRRLVFLKGDPKLEILTDSFETMVLLFSDLTAAEISSRGAPASPDPGRASGVYEKFFKKQRKDLKNNLQLRLLEDLLEQTEPSRGFFLAYFDARKLPPAFAIVDPEGLARQFAPEVGGEGVALYALDDEKGGYWYLSRTKEQIAAGDRAWARRRADAEFYAVDTTIQKNTRIRGTAEILFRPTAGGLRVLPVALLPKLRVEEAAFALGEDGDFTPAAFVQEDEEEDGDLAIVFPAPLPEGEPARLRLTYEGRDVLQNAGDGNFLVGARESWYPNLGTFTDLARFELTYRCPKGHQIVSVGELLEERTEGETRVSLWKSERPIRVAGFNYGKFRKLERADPESGLTVEVYTNPGEPDFVRQINYLLENRSDPGLRHISANADNLANAAMADGINTARVGTLYFGKLPDSAIAITQQTQSFFGQSWPTLIYLPYIAAFDGTIRRELGLQSAADFVEQVGLHEFAHQWWGHRVGWESYRDQWLSEGFAEFTAALVLQYTEGLRKSNAFWEKARRWILWKPRSATVSNDEAGPITDGWRLSTWRNRFAAQAMIYSKGAYVLHMLRMLMREPEAQEPDGKFIAMLKDFVAEQADKNPSTRDFQAAVERHMTPAMDAAGDGRMDWFFRQWVYGTEIPRFEGDLAVRPLENGRYRITGTLAQSGVSADFRSPVPIYVESKGEVRQVGRVSLVGEATVRVDLTVSLEKPPENAIANALHDVLER